MSSTTSTSRMHEEWATRQAHGDHREGQTVLEMGAVALDIVPCPAAKRKGTAGTEHAYPSGILTGALTPGARES